jgi:hypothetical protein
LPRRKKLILTAFLTVAVVLAAFFVFTKSKIVHHPEPAVAFVTTDMSLMTAIKSSFYYSLGSSFGKNVPTSKVYACNGSGSKVWLVKPLENVIDSTMINYTMENLDFNSIVLDKSVPVYKNTQTANNIWFLNLQTADENKDLLKSFDQAPLQKGWLIQSLDSEKKIYSKLRQPNFSKTNSAIKPVAFKIRKLDKEKLEWDLTDSEILNSYFRSFDGQDEYIGMLGFYDCIILLMGYNMKTRICNAGHTHYDPYGCPRIIFFDLAQKKIVRKYQLLAYFDSGLVYYAIHAINGEHYSYPQKTYSDDVPLICSTGKIPTGAQLADNQTVKLVRGERKGTDLALLVESKFNNQLGGVEKFSQLVDISPDNQRISILEVPYTELALRLQSTSSEWKNTDIPVDDIVVDINNNSYFRLNEGITWTGSSVLVLNRKNELHALDVSTVEFYATRSVVATKDAIWYLSLPPSNRSNLISIIGIPGMTQLIRYDPKTGEKKVVYEAAEFTSLTARID